MLGSARSLFAAGSGLLALLLLSVAVLTHPSNSTAAEAADQADAAVSRLAQSYPALARLGTSADLARDRPTKIEQLFLDMPEALVGRTRVVSRTDGRTVLLTPRTDGVICLSVLFDKGGGGSSCNTEGGSPALQTYGAAIGTVPASVKTLTYTLDDGSSKAGTPTEGLYYPPANATSVTYEADGKRETHDLLPVSAKPADIKETASHYLTPAG